MQNVNGISAFDDGLDSLSNAKTRILIASSIDSDALAWLQKHYEVVCAFNAELDILKDAIKGCSVIILRSGVNITAEVMACSPDLKLVIRAGSGTDNIDLDYVEQHGLKLYRIPGPGAQSVAEMSFAMMLSLSRKLMEADALTRRGRWAKSELKGFMLKGKTLGILGAGNIGSRTGQMGALWGMNVIGCRFSSTSSPIDFEPLGIRLTDFDEVITTSDYLSIHVPLNTSTRNMIDTGVLARMKPGAFLINLARGGVVNEAALYESLTREDGLAGAGVDVHEREGEGKVSPLADLPNVILTPHIGATTIDSQREIGELIIQKMKSFSMTQ